jgi:hypothetical protein
MAFVTANYDKGVSRTGLDRGTAQALNAALVNTLSYAATAAGIATATTTSKAKIVNTLAYLVGGTMYSKGATDNFWTLSGTLVAAGSFQKYILLIDTSGNASIQEGVQSTVNAASVAWTNISTVSPYAPFLDVVGSTKCIAGVLTVATDATHTFNPGTTLLGAAGITATYIDGTDQSLLPLLANAVGTAFGDT